MNIAIFGNTNNYLLLLAQGLRALGHNTRLIINRKELLHRPEARYPDWARGYPEWIVDCSNITDDDIAYRTPAIDKAIHHLTHTIDLAIVNDTGPALAWSLDVPHVAVLTGSDLTYYANYSSLDMRTSMWDREFKRSSEGRRFLMQFAGAVARQRDGILAADVVCYAERGLIPSGDALLDGIGVSDQRRQMLYLSNTIDLHPLPAPRNELLTILCGSRIVYRPSSNPALGAIDFKGTDILLAGFAQYVKAGGRGLLRLPRKGQDLDAAIALITELGIGPHVNWLDEMPLARFYEEMAAADLVCDQFGSSFPGMVTADAYALGRPVMGNFRSEVFSRRFGEPLPGFDARTPEDVARTLFHVNGSPTTLTDMGVRSRQYAERYLSPVRVAEELLNKLMGRAS